MPAFKIQRFLSADGDFQPVVAKALEIDSLARLLEGFLPAELAALTRVANLKDGKLVLLAANGPVAAKLKLLSEGLCVNFTKLGPKVNSVSVRVQPAAGRNVDAAMHKQPRLSPAALREMADLYTRLPDSPLRKALRSLLFRHGLTP